MSLNQSVIEALLPLKLQITVAESPVKKLNQFIVMYPLSDDLANHVDDRATAQIEELRLAVYARGNYLELRDKITKLLLDADIVITDRRYIEYELETKYHHYVIDVMVVSLL